jgi:hypothetical protein
MAAETSSDTLLLEFLKGRDTTCPVCGYNLRDLCKPLCPECAAPLQLAVGSTHFRLGAWIVGVIAFALGLGFDAVVAFLLLIMAAMHPPKTGAEWRAGLFLGGGLSAMGLACAIGLWVMVFHRPRWMRMLQRRRAFAAAAIFVVVFVVHAAFGLLVTTIL